MRGKHSDKDANLVKRARRGERDAFAALVLKYQDRIYNTMLRMTGSRDDAAELTQEVFLKALQNLASFKARSGFSTWLWSIALNQCTSRLRRRKVERASGISVSALSVPDDVRGVALDPSDEAAGPSVEAQRGELRAAIENAVLSLEEEFRQVVVLRDVQKMEYSHIAGALNVPVGTVKSRLHRARTALRAKLEEFI